MAIITELTRLVRPLRNGQITIPAEFRKALHLDAGVMIQMTLAGDELRIRPVKLAHIETGSHWLNELYLLYAPVRRQTESRAEDEINADIDVALAEVRLRYRPAAPPPPDPSS